MSSPAEREGCQALGLAPRGRVYPMGARCWHCSPLTQHCIVQAHIDHGFKVQHAEVALWVRVVECELPLLPPPHLSPLPDSLPRTPVTSNHSMEPTLPKSPPSQLMKRRLRRGWKPGGSGRTLLPALSLGSLLGAEQVLQRTRKGSRGGEKEKREGRNGHGWGKRKH